MTKTCLMMSERASMCSSSYISVFLCVSVCVSVCVLTHCGQRSVCQAAIMPMVAASSHVIISALLLPLFKDTLSLLLRRVIKLVRKIKGIQRERDREIDSPGDARGDSWPKLCDFVGKMMFNCFLFLTYFCLTICPILPLFHQMTHTLSLFHSLPSDPAFQQLSPQISSSLHHMQKIKTCEERR